MKTYISTKLTSLDFNSIRVFVGQNILIVALLILCIILSISNPKFMTLTNFLNIIRQTSYIGIMAVGMTFVIISAGIDLSVGSIAAFAGIIFGLAFHQLGLPWPFALTLALAGGMFVGTISGFSSSYLRIPAFVVTLGMLSIVRGTVMILTSGSPISPFPSQFTFIGDGLLLGIPFPAILYLIILLIAFFILKKTAYGREVYAVGGNLEAARLSGVNVKQIQMSVYIISGLMAAMGGLIMTARINSAVPGLGTGTELDAIAAVCVGGTSLYGGKGSIWGTMIGTLLMTVIRNGLNILNISTWWQSVAVGLILIVAVFVSTRKSI